MPSLEVVSWPGPDSEGTLEPSGRIRVVNGIEGGIDSWDIAPESISLTSLAVSMLAEMPVSGASC